MGLYVITQSIRTELQSGLLEEVRSSQVWREILHRPFDSWWVDQGQGRETNDASRHALRKNSHLMIRLYRQRLMHDDSDYVGIM